MNQLLLILIACFSLAMSCEKDENSWQDHPPILPAPVTYDFNDDGTDDFSVEYFRFTTDGFEISGEGIAGAIRPLNENMVLTRFDGISSYLHIGDIVRLDAEEPFYWIGFSSDLVWIEITTTNPDWPDQWRVLSKEPEMFYYVGAIIVKDGRKLVGWIKMRIYPKIGRIAIKDYEFRNSDFIVISR